MVSPFDRYRDLPIAALNLWLTWVAEEGRINHASHVLDIGCGTGQLTIPLQQQTGAKIYGLDLSPEMLKQAARKKGATGVSLSLGDAQDIPFLDGFFDCTLMALMLQHVGDKSKAIAEMFRVLKAGGRSIIWTLSHQQIRSFFLNTFFPSLPSIDLKRFPSIPMIRTQMKASGYRETWVRTIAYSSRIATKTCLDKVYNKYISTLALIPKKEFASGVEELKRRLCDQTVLRDLQFTWVVGEKGS